MKNKKGAVALSPPKKEPFFTEKVLNGSLLSCIIILLKIKKQESEYIIPQ